MKKRSIFKQTLSAVLCLCLMMGTVFMLGSCDVLDPTDTEMPDEDKASNKVTVVRAIKSIAAGEKLVRADLQEALVDKDTVPEGAATTIKDVANKFVKVPLVVGDYVIMDKVVDSIQFFRENNQSGLYKEYVIVTDYTSATPTDMADAIQKAIDENPNKTIYFPDGNYYVSKPIQTSADPAKAVSLRFSNYAYIVAKGDAEDWKEGSAVFELGGKDENGQLSTKSNFVGGIVGTGGIDGLCALKIKSGTVLVNNVSVKESSLGIDICPTARADIDSVVIIGGGADHAIGVLMEGEESTLTNMRICDVMIGVKLTGGNNVLRNIHPLASSRTHTRWSTGFYDVSSGNFYDVCYSDQFAIGFFMGPETRSVYNGCFLYWYAGTAYDGITPQHYGFYAAEKFNSIIRDSRVSLSSNHKNDCDLTYLKVEAGAVYDGNETDATRTPSHEGNGVVIYPRGDHQNDEHISDWEVFCRTDKLG